MRIIKAVLRSNLTFSTYGILVDDEEYGMLSQYTWSINTSKERKAVYAQTRVYGILTYMHWMLAGQPLNGFVTDHLDRNGINNQKANIDTVTIRQNSHNIDSTKLTSKYPGVHWDKKRKRYYARILVNGEREFLGSFNNEEDAGNAYKYRLASL
jgi:hypothetical protein